MTAGNHEVMIQVGSAYTYPAIYAPTNFYIWGRTNRDTGSLNGRYFSIQGTGFPTSVS